MLFTYSGFTSRGSRKWTPRKSDLPHGTVASIPGGLVNSERSFVFFVRVEKRFSAACGSHRLMRGIE